MLPLTAFGPWLITAVFPHLLIQGLFGATEQTRTFAKSMLQFTSAVSISSTPMLPSPLQTGRASTLFPSQITPDSF